MGAVWRAARPPPASNGPIKPASAKGCDPRVFDHYINAARYKRVQRTPNGRTLARSAAMLFGCGDVGHRMGGTPNWTATFTRRGEMYGQRLWEGWNTQVSGSYIDIRKGKEGGQRLEAQDKKMYTGGCILQTCLFPLQVVEDFGQLEVCFGVTARHQQTYCRYLGVGNGSSGRRKPGRHHDFFLAFELLVSLAWRLALMGGVSEGGG